MRIYEIAPLDLPVPELDGLSWWDGGMVSALVY